MMKKLLFTIAMLFAFVFIGIAQIATNGDYRSLASGDWNNPTTWQVRVGNVWTTALVAPSATSNVYIQNGHIISVDVANASCKDLQINIAGGVAIGVNVLNVNGKIRAYSGDAVVSTADESFTGTSVSASLGSSMITTTNTGETRGLLKFVGDTRNITETGEWHASGTVPRVAFALNSGQTGTLAMGIKSLELEFQSGYIIATSAAILAVGSNANNGKATIKSGAKLTSARSTQVLTYNSTTPFPVFEIEDGGVLELTNNNPEINCNNFINNGTVIYSGSTQNFAKTAFVTADQLTNYNNLIVSSSSSLSLPISKTFVISGELAINGGDLIIPSTSVLEIANGNLSITGANSSAHIKTLVDGGNSGVLKVKNLTSSKVFPVGTTSNYLPITLTPTTASDFEINVFEGATTDATPNGTALTPSQKNKIVNAVYNINRTSGSGDCEVSLGWNNALEGSDFSGFDNTQLGIATYIDGTYSAFSGSGDNTANTASQTVSTFGPMIVGELNTTLPVKLISFTASAELNSVKLSWKTTSEKSLAKYIIQHKNDSSEGFKNIYSVAAYNQEGTFDYKYVDVNAVAGNNYYRLISEDLDGTQYLSDVKSVNINGSNSVNIYPNPVSNQVFNVSGILDKDIIKVIDLTGQVVIQKIADNASINSVNVSEIKSGVYLVLIENRGKITSSKRIVVL